MQKSKNALDIRAFQRLVVLDTSRHLIQDVDGSQNDALPVLREGTGPMSTVERHESVNVLRLQRFKAGETADEIARSDGVTIETVLYSIRRAAEREQMLIHWTLIELKLQGAIDNELIRARVRKEEADKSWKVWTFYCRVSGRCQSGTRSLEKSNFSRSSTPMSSRWESNKPNKILVLEEMPTPNPINVNIQNNQFESTMDKDSSYEERLARILAAQEQGFPPEKTLLALPSGTDQAQG